MSMGAPFFVACVFGGQCCQNNVQVRRLLLLVAAPSQKSRAAGAHERRRAAACFRDVFWTVPVHTFWTPNEIFFVVAKPQKRPLCASPPSQIEDFGTRDASQNWAKEHTTCLEECRLRAWLASPCNFDHS